MSENRIGTLWLVGGGNMGGALLERWTAHKTADRIVLIDPADVGVPAGVHKSNSPALAGPSPDVAVLAVKPQTAAEAARPLRDILTERALCISIMAGVTLQTLSDLLPGRTLMRAMPNTPARVGKGATGLFGPAADGSQRAQAEALFVAAGTVHWLREESEFDALTALSGSGPAYVFRFVEALAAAGEAAGLEPGLAGALARRTLIGAGALLDGDTRSPAELRRAVTSPGGTTEAGLEALDEGPGLPGLARRAVKAAAQRSRELGSD